jgi:hypothetical protein
MHHFYTFTTILKVLVCPHALHKLIIPILRVIMDLLKPKNATNALGVALIATLTSPFKMQIYNVKTIFAMKEYPVRVAYWATF